MTIHSSTPTRRSPSAGVTAFLAICAVLMIPAAAARGAVPAGDESAVVMPRRAINRPGLLGASSAAQGYSARALVAAAENDLAAAHPGRAIVGYERARLLVPRSRAVTAGLARARAAANLPVVEAPASLRAARLLSAGEWGWVAIAGLTASAGALTALAWGLLRRRRSIAMSLAGLGIAALAMLGSWDVTPSPGQAIIVAAEATARIAPFAAAEPAFGLSEGAPVTIVRTYGDHALIAVPEGRGWVPRAVVETILPANAAPS
jgi:hypothetical protein